jgi:hypothetical protein
MRRLFCHSLAQQGITALLTLTFLLSLSGCGPNTINSTVGSANSALAAKQIWVGAWGDAMTNADSSTSDNPGGSEQSFRFFVIPTIGGTQERVRFSNVYGTTPVTIGAARLAVGQEGSPAIDTTHDAALSFSGQPSVTIAPGTVVVSDPVKVTFSYGQVLAISVYLKGAFSAVSRHDSLFMTNYRTPTGSGDQTNDPTGSAFTQTLSDWLLINGVDVYGSYQGTIALFGSSTTDGFHSNYSSDQVYPTPNVPVAGQHTSRLSDWLAQRLNAAGYQIGVVNEGVPGDTVTDDVTNQINDVKNANQRIAQDVLGLPSLLGMVTYFGSIDIRSPDCMSAPAIETATQQMIATAAAAKAPVILATIPPSAFCMNPAEANYGPVPSSSDPYAGGSQPGPINGGETQRIAFNAWIRSVGVSMPGVIGIADFDQALADPARPDFLQSLYNSGDNFHPNGMGYKAESLVIPYSLLLPH